VEDIVPIASRDQECSEELAACDPEALGICICRSGEDVLDEVSVISICNINQIS
jgi:hypothetical protein